MTDKQIIIDGVDVSECTRYCADNGKCTAFKSQYLCSERDNCYTKRILKKNKTINILKEKLLRKEQECKELKKENYEITEEVSIDRDLFAEIDQLKAENDELRKTVMQKCPQCGEIYLNPIGAKLYEALTEIKEIAQYDVHTTRTDLCLKLNWIKKKISEVENGQ